jgi:hypothetical protein
MIGPCANKGHAPKLWRRPQGQSPSGLGKERHANDQFEQQTTAMPYALSALECWWSAGNLATPTAPD